MMRASVVWWLALLAVWAVAAMYVWHYLPHGWVPHDEGTLAQSAQRVLAGELPHRDFAAIYTGGLSYLNAAAFHWLGTNLWSLRLVLFAVFLLWVPALYYIATRLASPPVAAAAVALAVAWSLPAYSAAMPSWYNLFFATFGTVALFRQLETGRRRWLLLAGVCGGLSCLVKIVGLYYIAAALLCFVYREQCVARSTVSAQRANGRRWYSLSITALLLGFIGLLVALIARRLGLPEFIDFIMPGAAIVALLLWREWTGPAGMDGRRFRALLGLVVPFMLAVCIPILLFLIPYIHSGSVGALVDGVFITPTKRLGFAAVHPPGGTRLLVGLISAACLGFIPALRPRLRPMIVAAIAGTLCVLLLTDGRGSFYRLVWSSMCVLAPVVVLVGVWLVARHERRMSPLHRQRFVLLLSVTAMCSLVQFPFSAFVYFFYVAPLIVLAGLAVVMVPIESPTPRLIPAVALGFYLLFAIARIHPGFIWVMGRWYTHDNQTKLLAGDRGGIRVSPADDSMYTQLVAVVRAHATGGYLYATPDCPEVYFLAGLRNPTRTIFDFFDDTTGRTARILSTLAAHHVTAVVLNGRPAFSGPVPPALRAPLEVQYPQHETIGRFVVRWKE